MDLLDTAQPSPIVAGAVEPATIGGRADPDAFDWSEDKSVIFGYQPATAVYRNKFDAIVIRQEGTDGEDDQFVFLRDADSVRIVIKALQAEIGGCT
jgi:hypothetical protein